MNSIETDTQNEGRKSIKDIKQVFQNPLKKDENAETENIPANQSRKSIKGDNAWIKKKNDIEEPPLEPRSSQEKLPKKIMEPVIDNSENIVKEEIDAKANIKKFEEIARRNSEKQKIIREVEEKKQKKLENIENKTPEGAILPVQEKKSFKKEDFIVETIETVKVQEIVSKIENNNSVILGNSQNLDEDFEKVISESSESEEETGDILVNDKIKIEDQHGHQEIKTELIENSENKQENLDSQGIEIITDSKGNSSPGSDFENVKGSDSGNSTEAVQIVQEENQIKSEIQAQNEEKEQLESEKDETNKEEANQIESTEMEITLKEQKEKVHQEEELKSDVLNSEETLNRHEKIRIPEYLPKDFETLENRSHEQDEKLVKMDQEDDKVIEIQDPIIEKPVKDSELSSNLQSIDVQSELEKTDEKKIFDENIEKESSNIEKPLVQQVDPNFKSDLEIKNEELVIVPKNIESEDVKNYNEETVSEKVEQIKEAIVHADIDDMEIPDKIIFDEASSNPEELLKKNSDETNEKNKHKPKELDKTNHKRIEDIKNTFQDEKLISNHGKNTTLDDKETTEIEREIKQDTTEKSSENNQLIEESSLLKHETRESQQVKEIELNKQISEYTSERPDNKSEHITVPQNDFFEESQKYSEQEKVFEQKSAAFHFENLTPNSKFDETPIKSSTRTPIELTPNGLGDLAEYQDLRISANFDPQNDEKIQNISILPSEVCSRKISFQDKDDDYRISIDTTPQKQMEYDNENQYNQEEVVKRSPLGRKGYLKNDYDGEKMRSFSFDDKIDTQNSLMVSKEIEEKQNLLLADVMATDRSSAMNNSNPSNDGICKKLMEIINKCFNSKRK